MSRVLAVGVLTLTVAFSAGVRAGRQSAVEPPPRVVVTTIQRDPATAQAVNTRTVPVGTAAIT